MKGTTFETAVEMEAKPERTKQEKIADAIKNAQNLDSLSKAVARLESLLKSLAGEKLSIHRTSDKGRFDFDPEEAAMLLATGIRSRIAELNREIDAIVEGLP